MSDAVDPATGDTATLPDRALQSALEFAVGIAAAGAKLRPPLPFPSGLKPFLRFHKLPPAALAKVRSAVEADDGFHRRLGSVATEELVDEIGMLWLVRPEGWHAQAAALVQAAADDALDPAGDLRREQRRREAAEAAAARSVLEVSTMRDQLQSERSARAAAEELTARLEAELRAVRQQLQQMERAVRKRAAGADAATEKTGSVEAALLATRTELAAAVAARDAALADRAAAHEGIADVERVRMLLSEALALTRVATPPTKRRHRKPIALPGGVYGNSEAAGEHLLRTTDVMVLVDGYNVAKLGWPKLSLAEQRNVTIDAAENLARRWGTLIHLVFDGASVVGASASGRRLVRVSYSPDGVIADDVLRAEVAALHPDRPVVVVTNDQAVANDVRAAGANVLASDVFLQLARR